MAGQVTTRGSNRRRAAAALSTCLIGTGLVAVSATHAVAIPTPVTTTTIGVYRPSDERFLLRDSNTSGVATVSFRYGVYGDLPVAGDWDGNGTTTVGVYRAVSGHRRMQFFLRNSNSSGGANLSFAYGIPNDVPLAGDWDGNGTTTVGVYRPVTATFYLRNSNSGGNADVVVQYGAVNSGGAASFDVPVVGDWDGNGTTTVGVYRVDYNQHKFTFALRNSNTPGLPDILADFGTSGVTTVPVVGDWDGNGTTTIGTYNYSYYDIRKFLLRNSDTTGAADVSVIYGGHSDVPLVGDWDGS